MNYSSHQTNLDSFFFRVAGHPLAQNERSLHVFLQEEKIDRDKYVPGKVRSA
jgi:sorting nexin-3/12